MRCPWCNAEWTRYGWCPGCGRPEEALTAEQRAEREPFTQTFVRQRRKALEPTKRRAAQAEKDRIRRELEALEGARAILRAYDAGNSSDVYFVLDDLRARLLPPRGEEEK